LSLASVVRQLPLRLSIGAFFINSGLSKVTADETAAAQLQGFASTAYPVMDKVESQLFARALAAGELALGTALLLPIVPGWLAGAGLTAFATGTAGLYLRVPGMRQEGSIRPTEQGIPIAKDAWLLGAGLTLILDDLLERFPRR
jgi:uncharacterized membrane protein YphA (DoxX/SURF4 family)